MGLFKKWVDKVQKDAEDKLKKEADPQEQKKAKKENAEKTFRRTTDAIKLARKGLEVYNEAAKKVDEVTHDLTEKAIDLAEKAKPMAERLDKATGNMVEKAKDALGSAADKAGEKIEQVKKDNANNPTTGSSLLDILTPGVPETDATKPRKTADKKPPAPPAAG